MLLEYPVHGPPGAAARLSEQQGQPSQLLQGGGQRGKPWRTQHNHFLPEQGEGSQLGEEAHLVHHTHIQLVGKQQLLDFPGVDHQSGKLRLGKPLLQLGHDCGQTGGAEGDIGSHPQRAGLFPEQVFGLLESPEDLLGRGKQCPSGSGQVDPAIHPFKEFGVVVAFQFLYSQAHCGLGGSQGLGRLGKTHQAADFHKNLQVTLCHTIPSHK